MNEIHSFVKNSVYESYKGLIEEKGINIVPNEDVKMISDNGIDSLGIVTFIIGIEDKLDVELDDYLEEFGKCINLGEVVDLVERITNLEKYK